MGGARLNGPTAACEGIRSRSPHLDDRTTTTTHVRERLLADLRRNPAQQPPTTPPKRFYDGKGRLLSAQITDLPGPLPRGADGERVEMQPRAHCDLEVDLDTDGPALSLHRGQELLTETSPRFRLPAVQQELSRPGCVPAAPGPTRARTTRCCWPGSLGTAGGREGAATRRRSHV